MLTGERVRLRPVKRSDVSFFVKWLNDPEVTRYLRRNLPLTEMGEEKWIEELATTRKETDVLLVIEIREGESWRPIGSCGLHRIDSISRTAHFGISIGEKGYWSQGYGTEASQLLIS